MAYILQLKRKIQTYLQTLLEQIQTQHTWNWTVCAQKFEKMHWFSPFYLIDSIFEKGALNGICDALSTNQSIKKVSLSGTQLRFCIFLQRKILTFYSPGCKLRDEDAIAILKAVTNNQHTTWLALGGI